MANTQTGCVRRESSGAQWLTTIASLLVGSGFLALWFWLLPSWFGFRVASAPSWRWIAAVPSALGFAVAIRCMWDFGHTGRGTPAPFAPPQRLVVVGFYRYVRNPMYLGFFTGWIGLWIVFGHANWSVIAGAAAAVYGTTLFVRLYEEPHLRKIFGADYDEYCQHVRRWLPRWHAWEQRTTGLTAVR